MPKKIIKYLIDLIAQLMIAFERRVSSLLSKKEKGKMTWCKNQKIKIVDKEIFIFCMYAPKLVSRSKYKILITEKIFF